MTQQIERKWKYLDEDRPIGFCYDCNLPYQDFPTEMVIAQDEWEQINPTYHEGAGLLCHNCMIERLRIVGILFPKISYFSINKENDHHQTKPCEHLWDIDSWQDILLSEEQQAFVCGLKAECRNCGKVVEHHPITWSEVNQLVKEVYTPHIRWWRY